MKKWLVSTGFLLATAAFCGDLAAVKAEPDPNKRSERALDNARVALEDARVAFRQGDASKGNSALQEIGESAELCYQSLHQSNQKPHRSKYYKHAELRLRELGRMISGFADQLPLDQRETAMEVHKSVQAIHDKILVEELEKK
jgi:hypothetical protein